MKKTFTQALLVCFAFLLSVSSAFAGGSSNWANKYEPQKVFIENKGQFKIKTSEGFDPKVQYAYDGHEQNFYFTSSGVVLELVDIKKPKQKENEEREMKERMKKGITQEDHAKMEAEEHRMLIKKDELRAQWIGANPNVQIIAEDQISSTFSYCFKNKDGKLVNASAIAGYKKLIYKGLYPNIDVVYVMHPDRGIKYSVIVHPGGDITQVKLQYSKNAHLLSDGTVKTKSRLGDFIDHAPATFYEDDKTTIASSYSVKNNVISFDIPNYDATKTVVIDPWTQTPIFNTAWHSVWECDKDIAGNVYIIGGIMPMQLLKYNSGGTLQWTYNTPYDTSNSWLGTFAVDNAGNSYVTAGSTAQIQKISTAGVLLQNNTNPSGSIFNNQEFWSISFNCDQTQLVIGGTDGTSSTLGPFIFNMDLNTLNELNSVQVHGSGSLFGFPPRIQEVRAITACGNSNYAFLTHDSIGYIHQGLTACLPPGSVFPFHVDNGLALGYKCEDYRTDNSGICALKSFGGYVFVHKGNQVQKRDLYTGTVVATATIPGGAFPNSGFGGGNYVSNSGIDIDSCGNVYCGSTNAVVKFSINLAQLGTFATAFNVYDVTVTSTGDLIAVGSTGNANSGARTGYVQSFAAGACRVIAVVCCDAGICPHAAVCISDAPFNLTPTTAGGTWSGTGITNTANGTFSPSVAGVGVFTIYHTLPCGRDSMTITVNNCSAVSLCRNANGTLTVSGGTAPYTWQTWDSIGRTCQGGIVFAGFCTGTWVTTYGWRTFSTGATLTVTPPAGADTLRVIDNAGTTVTSFNIANLPPCVATCNLVVIAGIKRNVSCLGGSNGSAHVSTTGGTAPLTYAWSAGGSTVDSAFNLAAGTYTVTVHDVNNCSGTATFSITQPASSVSAGIAINLPASCAGNTGKIKITVTGGTPAYSYVWSPNVSTVDSAINLAAGAYHVTVSDQGSCSTVLTINVGTAAGITVTPGAQRNVSCLGGSNGSAHVTTTGGTAPLTYTWSAGAGGSIVDSAFNLAAGSYTVTVRDANGCSGVATFAITQPASSVSAGVAINLPASCGANTGKIKITVTGGTPAYSYNWSPNVSTVDSAINLAGGTYHVTVSDQGSCSTVLTIVVGTAAGITVTPGAQRNVSCLGGSNGSAHVTTSGGTAPLTYVWSAGAGGSTVDSAFNLAAGTYTVTVHDANNCSGVATFAITQPASSVSVGIAINQPATCGNNTGKIKITVTGGIPAYSYVWSPNVSTVDSAINLAAGTYHVTVSDQGSCTSALTITVGSAPGITVTAGVKKDVSCFGGSNGSAHVIVTGGTTPYTYTWTPNVSTVDSAVNLTAGTYSVEVHDANNCTGTASFTIAQPTTAVSAAPTVTPASCGNSTGKIVLHAAGGTPGYTYVWSPNVSTTDSAINLAPGTYNVTITDTKGCISVTSAVVAPSAGITVTAGIKTDVRCFGGSTGTAHVTVTGGTTPYTYSWTPNVSTVDSAINLAAGTYTVTVHDANNCTGAASFNISQPAAPLAVTNTVTQATCNSSNGKIVLHVTGGTPAYTYTWSPNVSTVDSAVNLAANTYNITITDSRGCATVTSVVISLTPSVSVSAGVKTNVSCFGGNNGTAHVIATGGVTPYTYSWTPNVSTVDSAVNLAAGTYTVTVRDANNCTGSASFTITQPAAALAATNTTVAATCGSSNGKVVINVTGGTPAYSYAWSPNVSTVDSAINLAIGTYIVTITDSKGCTLTTSASVASSSGFSVSAGVQVNVNCFGGNTGSAHVIAVGGTTPYTYTWSPNVSSVDSAVNLTAGTYTVTVHDATTCSGAITFNITQPAAALAATAVTTQGSCGVNNGKIVVTATGGTPGYTYGWTPSGSVVDSVTNLGVGTYTVTVTDSKGCTTTLSRAITVSPAISISPGAITNVSCFGGSNGSAHVIVSGGTAPFVYNWSIGVARDSLTNVVAGTYLVTVTDGALCTAATSFTITQPAAALSATATATSTTCGNNNGKVVVTATGGTTAYSYTWSPNVSTVDSAINLAVNTYNVTVTDAHGCNTTVTASVTPTSSVTLTLGTTKDVSCNGGNDGNIHVTAGNGITPYTYTWSPNVSTTDSAVNLVQGTYSVTVHDANGCQASVSTTINEPAVLGVSVATTLANCSTSDGTATATVTGGTGPMVYQWSAGGSAISIDPNLAAGGYTLTVTDAHLCRVTTSFNISNFNAPTVSVASTTDLLCNGVNTGSIHLAVAGGTPVYTYIWSPVVSTADSATNLAAGSYTVTVRDASNCIAVTSATLTQPTAITVAMTAQNADCGLTNGWAHAAVSGGTPPYRYVWNSASTGDSSTGLGAGMYRVTITDANGCSKIDSIAVNVNNGPPTPTITGGPLTFCQGGSVVLTSSAATGNTWSTTETTQSITVTTSGTYTVTQTVGGCTSAASAAVTVTVNPIPAAPTITASGPLTFCPGGSVTLTSSASTGNEWSTTQTSQSITVTTSGNYTVVQVLAGCPSPASVPTAVTVLSNPTPHITPSAPSVCPGDSVVLDATTTGATAYAWNNNATTASVRVPEGAYTVTVTVNGCQGSDNITIGTLPVLGQLVIKDSFLVCIGDTVKLDATTSDATSYHWTGTGGLNEATPVVYVQADTAHPEGMYYVDVTNSCGALTDSVMITFQACDCKMVMGNAFTPNGDGKNEKFGPVFLCNAPKSLSMHVYNRWGQKVFDTDVLNGQWDGKYKGDDQPAGVYTYYVEFVGMENHKEKTFKMVGNVTLIR